LQYVSHSVWPNEESSSIRRNAKLIHYDAQEPIFGDRFDHTAPPVLPDFEGNRPHEFFTEQRRKFIEASVLHNYLHALNTNLANCTTHC
jgi:hypothetical protein